MTHIEIELFAGIQRLFKGPELTRSLEIFRYHHHDISAYKLRQSDFFTHDPLNHAYQRDMTPESLSQWHIDVDNNVASCTSEALWYLIKQYSPQDPHHATQLFIKLFKFVPTHNAAQSMNVKRDLQAQITDYFTSDAGVLDTAR